MRPQVYYWLECIGCGKTLKPEQFYFTCPECDGLLKVERDEEWIDHHVGTGKKAQTHFDNIRFGVGRRKYPNDSGVFMWLPHLLPGFPLGAVVSLRERCTDLFEIPDWLKWETGLSNLYIKMEGQLPSESFKDRGMSIAVSEALRLQKSYPELGIRYIACASTGDTSASAAVYSTYVRDKMQCVVFLPHENVSPEQLFQALAHGARVISIKHPDGFDACMKLIQEYCDQHPEVVLVNSKNPFRVVGQETTALEICQDLLWEAPDWIAIPCGNGGNLTALLTSLLRMKSRGMIQRLPGVIVAQTESANTLVRWARSGFRKYEPKPFQNTVASAMNIQDPVSFPRIQKLRKHFDMQFFDVSEEAIQRTRALFMRGGANICPQSAVALDAVMQARAHNIVEENDVVVAISTASGLKFTKSGIAFHMEGERSALANPPLVVDGNIEAIEDVLV